MMVIDMLMVISVCVMPLYNYILLVLVDRDIPLGVMMYSPLFKGVIVLIVLA